jgi:hypothetical protein
MNFKLSIKFYNKSFFERRTRCVVLLGWRWSGRNLRVHFSVGASGETQKRQAVNGKGSACPRMEIFEEGSEGFQVPIVVCQPIAFLLGKRRHSDKN